VLPTESKDLRLLFVSALHSGYNARRSSLNLYVDTAWSILPFGVEWTSCLAQGRRSLKEQVPPASRPGAPADRSWSVGWWSGCRVDLPVHAALHTIVEKALLAAAGQGSADAAPVRKHPSADSGFAAASRVNSKGRRNQSGRRGLREWCLITRFEIGQIMAFGSWQRPPGARPERWQEHQKKSNISVALGANRDTLLANLPGRVWALCTLVSPGAVGKKKRR
jgi:hypothetical protein